MQTDKSSLKGGSGKAAQSEQSAGFANEAVRVTGPQFHEHSNKQAKTPRAPKQDEVVVDLYEQHLAMDADPQLREIGKAQIKTKVTSTKESLSVPVIREHLNVSHEPIDRSQWVEGATVRMGDNVQEVVLHGTNVEGTVRRETVPYDRVRLSVAPEVSHVTVEADCARQECEIVEPNIAEGDVNVKVSDASYGVRELGAEQRQFAKAAEFSAADEDERRDGKGRFAA